MKSKVLTILTLLSSVCLFTKAQTGKLFNADNLLPSSFISQVYLDRDGFVWAVTRNGICRYDGYQAQSFKKERGDGLASNYVNCMMQDQQGRFYLGMYGALQTWDGHQFQEVTVKDINGHVVPCYITCIVCLRSGKMVAGTSGHGLLSIDSPTEAHQMGGKLATLHTVEQVMEDREGRLWLVADNERLLVYANDKIQARYFDSPSDGIGVNCVSEDRDGRIYIGTSQHGVMRLEGKEFRPIEATGAKTVTALCPTRDGRLLIGYDGEGIGILNPKTGHVVDNPYYSSEVDLKQAKVASIAEDGGGNFWIGMLQKGIYMQPRRSGDFHYMGYKLGTRNIIGQACVTSTLVDSKGRTWVGTDKDGLYLLDANQQLLRHYRQDFPQTVLTLAEDWQGRIWTGTYKEGYGWIGTDGAYHRQPTPHGADLSVFGIAADASHRLWLGTMGHGLMCLMPDGTLKTYTMKDGAANDRKVNSIANNYITKLSASPDGRRIYVATTMGACCLDIERDSWTSTFGRNCLDYGTATRIAKEYSGMLWVGTNDGLLCYDLTSHTLKSVGSFVGVASIESDQQGRLWVGTDHGLCCHDPRNGQTERYFVDNGLQSNEFSDNASSTTPSGAMVFGGVAGITWFDPAKIYQAEWKAKVKLIGFVLNGQPINSQTHSGNYRVCDTTAIAARRFDLAYNENHFTIQLSTLTYDSPEHITYVYRINDEPEVRLHPGQNEVTFTHLSPGTYRFRVKAELNNQQTPEREFTVVVHAPWYATWWACCLYVLALALAVWQYLAMRRRKEQDRLRLQEHIHAEEMGEAKLRFFMNISHEIRTPMTLIVTPLLSLMKQDGDPQRQGIYRTIRRNAERILGLINQMMDLRKIDKGMMQMRMQETDLIAFVGDIYALFSQQAKAKNIHFTYEHGETDTLPVWIDRAHFDKVVVNILSNAFKFTPTGGVVSLRVDGDGRQATIAVSDNGEQIPADKLDRIFERFYQSPSSINDRNVGTGIGLDLTRSLVELHHGSITAHNLEEGCEFAVTIPCGSAHLREDEKATAASAEDNTLTSLLDESTEATAAMTDAKQKVNRRPSIIIAEDDDEIRSYITQELGNDYDVTGCANGREALAEAIKTVPDLVISDIMMPEMDGTTLCSKLKANPDTNHVPVVLLTAKNRDEDHLEGLETGADAYIVKPFNMDILRRTVVNLINTSQLLRLKYGRNDKLEQQVDSVEMKSPDEKLLERIMNVINHNVSNSDLSIDMIAEEVGISRVHLHRKMKELTGQTPHGFIRNIRLKRAANLLSRPGMNVTEVMYACGFNNAASFSTIFKKFYGMTPREYMQDHQDGQTVT